MNNNRCYIKISQKQSVNDIIEPHKKQIKTTKKSEKKKKRRKLFKHM